MMEIARILGQRTNRELLRNLLVSDFVGKYKQSLLGFMWNLILPLVTMLIYSFVFGNILNVRPNTGRGGPFVLFVFTGFLIWFTFSDNLGAGCTVLLSGRNLIKKVAFPYRILLANLVLSGYIRQLIMYGVYIAFSLVLTGRVYAWVAMIPVVMIVQMVYCYALTLIVSAITPYFRDFQQIVSLFLRAAMYLTFVMYPLTYLSSVPLRTALLLANPVASLILIVRHLSFPGYSDYPLNAVPLASVGFWTLAFLVVGGRVFSRLSRDLPDIL